MADMIISWRNRGDAATLSGGSWVGAMPLPNLQSDDFSLIARSTNTALASTKFEFDLGTRRPISVLNWIGHNCTIYARYRWRLSNTAGVYTSPVLDTGWQDVWPIVYTMDQVDWNEAEFWSGKLSEEDREGYPAQLLAVLAEQVAARYGLLEIDDQGNPAGYIQARRLWVGKGWSLSHDNPRIKWEVIADIDESAGGSQYINPRAMRRVGTFEADWMTHDEAHGIAFEMDRHAGIHKGVLVIPDYEDTKHVLRRTIFGRMTELSDLEYPIRTQLNTKVYSIREII